MPPSFTVTATVPLAPGSASEVLIEAHQSVCVMRQKATCQIGLRDVHAAAPKSRERERERGKGRNDPQLDCQDVHFKVYTTVL